MSQAGIISVAGGGGGGTPIETLQADDGFKVPPTNNNIIVPGGSITANHPNGIWTTGNVGGSTFTINLSNRIQGSTTTSDGAGQTQQFSLFPLGAVAGTYIFDTNITAFNVTDSLAATYKVSISRRTNGAAAFNVQGADTFTAKEEGAMSGVIVSITTAGNTFTINVTGLAGKVIDWVAVSTYVFAS